MKCNWPHISLPNYFFAFEKYKWIMIRMKLILNLYKHVLRQQMQGHRAQKSVSAPNMLKPGVTGWSCPCSSVWLSCRFPTCSVASSGILTLALGFLGAQLSHAPGSHMEVFAAAVLFQLSHAREKLWVSAFTKLKVSAKIPPLMLFLLPDFCPRVHIE